jgi:hypothetical protein
MMPGSGMTALDATADDRIDLMEVTDVATTIGSVLEG